MYVKSKSTVSESVSQSVTRSPIELFWTAKNMLKFRKKENSGGKHKKLKEQIAKA